VSIKSDGLEDAVESVKAKKSQNAILLCHATINNPTNVKAAIGGRAGIGFPFKNIA
jgi:hypothetical protein